MYSQIIKQGNSGRFQRFFIQGNLFQAHHIIPASKLGARAFHASIPMSSCRLCGTAAVGVSILTRDLSFFLYLFYSQHFYLNSLKLLIDPMSKSNFSAISLVCYVDVKHCWPLVFLSSQAFPGPIVIIVYSLLSNFLVTCCFCVCMCSFACTCVCLERETRKQPWVSSTLFLRQGLSRLELKQQARLAVQQASGICLPGTEAADARHYAHLLHTWALGSSLGPHACIRQFTN